MKGEILHGRKEIPKMVYYIGVWMRRFGRKYGICIPLFICYVVSDKYGRLKSGNYWNFDYGI